MTAYSIFHSMVGREITGVRIDGKSYTIEQIVSALAAAEPSQPVDLDTLERFEPINAFGEGAMQVEPGGDWVRYDDVYYLIAALALPAAEVKVKPLEEIERVSTEAAMSQWERSLKRPDMSEKDRVRGAIEAYKRQSFAFSLAAPSQAREE